MKSLEELITATRRNLSRRRDKEPEPIPAGFANRILRQLDRSRLPAVFVWQRASYVGLAVAALITLVVAHRVDSEPRPGGAALWIEITPEEAR